MAKAKYNPRVKYHDGLINAGFKAADGSLAVQTTPDAVLGKHQSFHSVRWSFRQDGKDTARQVSQKKHPSIYLQPGTHTVELTGYINEKTKAGTVRKKIIVRDQIQIDAEPAPEPRKVVELSSTVEAVASEPVKGFNSRQAAAAFTADLLKHEGIQVNLTLGRGVTAKHAIKALYSVKFPKPLKDTAPVRQLAARLAECLSVDQLTYTVLNANGGRVRSTDPIGKLRRTSVA